MMAFENSCSMNKDHERHLAEMIQLITSDCKPNFSSRNDDFARSLSPFTNILTSINSPFAHPGSQVPQEIFGANIAPNRLIYNPFNQVAMMGKTIQNEKSKDRMGATRAESDFSSFMARPPIYPPQQPMVQQPQDEAYPSLNKQQLQLLGRGAVNNQSFQNDLTINSYLASPAFCAESFGRSNETEFGSSISSFNPALEDFSRKRGFHTCRSEKKSWEDEIGLKSRRVRRKYDHLLHRENSFLSSGTQSDSEQSNSENQLSTVENASSILIKNQPHVPNLIKPNEKGQRIVMVSTDRGLLQLEINPIRQKYRGVCWNKCNKSWKASIKIQGKNTHIGYFDISHEAALAYDLRAIEVRGQMSQLNFVHENKNALHKSLGVGGGKVLE